MSRRSRCSCGGRLARRRTSPRCAASGARSRRGRRSGSGRPYGDPTVTSATASWCDGDVGTAAWISCAGKPPWTLPDDQREDDALSLTYDWPLEEELELLGHPRLRVTITSPHPVAFLSARLCDVFPDGASALVSRGVLNLTHRESHSQPKPLEAGVPTPIDLELEATSWIFEAGHRLRLALAGSDWPNTWPPPHGGALEVARDTVELELPVLDGPPVAAPPVFSPPPPPTKLDEPEIEQPPIVRLIERDAVGRQTRVVTELWVSLRRPLRREDRGGLRRPGGSLRREPRPCVGERANALLDRVAGGVRHDRSAPQLSLHVSSVPRRRRGHRLGRRA